MPKFGNTATLTGREQGPLSHQRRAKDHDHHPQHPHNEERVALLARRVDRITALATSSATPSS
jgi:hypothetical protein